MGRKLDTPTRNAGPYAALLVAIAMSAAACSGANRPGVASGGSSSPTGSASQSALAFSRCMRSHGIPNYPDPGGNGATKKTARQLGVSDSKYDTALRACAHLLPNDGGPDRAETRREMTVLRSFARCMRSHGVPNWPDPTVDPGWRANFYLQQKVDANAPQIVTKIHACQHLIPPDIRTNGAVGGVPMCPGDPPGPDARHPCG